MEEEHLISLTEWAQGVDTSDYVIVGDEEEDQGYPPGFLESIGRKNRITLPSPRTVEVARPVHCDNTPSLLIEYWEKVADGRESPPTIDRYLNGDNFLGDELLGKLRNFSPSVVHPVNGVPLEHPRGVGNMMTSLMGGFPQPFVALAIPDHQFHNPLKQIHVHRPELSRDAIPPHNNVKYLLDFPDEKTPTWMFAGFTPLECGSMMEVAELALKWINDTGGVHAYCFLVPTTDFYTSHSVNQLLHLHSDKGELRSTTGLTNGKYYDQLEVDFCKLHGSARALGLEMVVHGFDEFYDAFPHIVASYCLVRMFKPPVTVSLSPIMEESSGKDIHFHWDCIVRKPTDLPLDLPLHLPEAFKAKGRYLDATMYRKLNKHRLVYLKKLDGIHCTAIAHRGRLFLYSRGGVWREIFVPHSDRKLIQDIEHYKVRVEGELFEKPGIGGGMGTCRFILFDIDLDTSFLMRHYKLRNSPWAAMFHVNPWSYNPPDCLSTKSLTPLPVDGMVLIDVGSYSMPAHYVKTMPTIEVTRESALCLPQTSVTPIVEVDLNMKYVKDRPERRVGTAPEEIVRMQTEGLMIDAIYEDARQSARLPLFKPLSVPIKPFGSLQSVMLDVKKSDALVATYPHPLAFDEGDGLIAADLSLYRHMRWKTMKRDKQAYDKLYIGLQLVIASIKKTANPRTVYRKKTDKHDNG